jgi:hypothetical protein
MAQPQSFKNHTRIDPLFHFFILPLMFLNIPASIFWYVHHHMHTHLHSGLWFILISVVLFLLTTKVRIYALKNQDRIIRLEEQLRLADLLPESKIALVDKVTLEQYIALRFASDPEAPSLAARAVAENLTPKQIKEAIKTWRADNHRI